ncbi:MAG: class I SAM-dependent methyltransferase [Betaproteobacteria bacterium]|nr:class I SAM-dependent methyltransferase [Betaproteobacteria bacterium]
MEQHDIVPPSAWVVRWAPRITHGTVLDVACGRGRHAKLFLERGLKVVAIDRKPQDIPGARFVQADLEDGSPWPLPGEKFEGIVVTNYLYRPLLSIVNDSLAGNGILIYETFMVGNERFGRPSNPEFLLHPGELLEAFRGLRVLGFEEGEVSEPKPALIQRLCAVREAKG